MPRRSIKKRRTTAKAQPVAGKTRDTHKPIPKKTTGKSGNNPSAVNRRRLGDREVGLAGPRRPASMQQREITSKRVVARRQKHHRIEHVEPTQEPQIRAESFTQSKRTLSAEARELLAKVDEGGIPLMTTRNLERIAGEHGIAVSDDMTPNDVVKLLRDLTGADGTALQTANEKQTSSIRETGNQGIEKAKKQPDIFSNVAWSDASDSNDE